MNFSFFLPSHLLTFCLASYPLTPLAPRILGACSFTPDPAPGLSGLFPGLRQLIRQSIQILQKNIGYDILIDFIRTSKYMRLYLEILDLADNILKKIICTQGKN